MLVGLCAGEGEEGIPTLLITVHGQADSLRGAIVFGESSLSIPFQNLLRAMHLYVDDKR